MTIDVRRRRFVDLPADHRPSPAEPYRIAHFEPDERGPLIPGIGGEQYPLLLAVFAALLFRLTRQDVIDFDVFVRDAVGQLQGVWAAILDVHGDTTLAGLAGRTNDAVGGFLCGDTPPNSARRATANLAVTICTTSDPITNPRALLDAAGDRDVHLFLTRSGENVSFSVAYNAVLFEPSTIRRLLERLAVGFSMAQRTPDAKVRELAVMTPAEVMEVSSANDAPPETAPFEPVHRQFEAVARRLPDSTALHFRERTLTYRELDARANGLAAELIEAGVARGVPVAVCLPPSLEIPVALLAILKAGGVYLPLDPTHPPALIESMLSDAKPKLVLTRLALRHLTSAERYRQHLLEPDAVPPEAPAVNAGGPINPLDPTHLLYTSGTTGKPKGVLGNHGNLAHYIASARNAYRFTERDVFCALARYTFSISLFELLSPLCCGGSLWLLERDEVLAPDRLARVLEQVTVVHAGPSLLGSLFRYLKTNASAPRTFSGIRHASSGGDLVGVHVMREMSRVFENAEIFVIYGCTEISCMGCTYPVARGSEPTRTWVGKAFPGVKVRVVDPDGNLCAWGAVGEICFAGAGVVPGYLDRAELTRERFAALGWNPDGLLEPDAEDAVFYRTGDMGRLGADGQLEILGRRDFQVQIRGVRVELAGIESVIRQLGLAEQCAVALKKLDDQDVRLGAFVVRPQTTDVGAFRRALGAILPDYMLPQGLIVLESLPLTANGKLDRRALQEMPWSSSKATGEEPTTLIERQLAEAFGRVLGIGAVGVDDDFFDLGGHSLLAVLLMEELHNKLGVQLPPGLLFEAATVRSLAERARGAFATELKAVPLNRSAWAPAFFLMTGVYIYRPLALELAQSYCVYGVYSGKELVTFEDGPSAPSISDLADDYLDIVRRQQPHGPYRLGGLSFGGIVAYEVAQRLRDAGEEVLFVALIDSVLPQDLMTRVARWTSLSRREMIQIAWRNVRDIAAARLGRAARSGFVRYDHDPRLGPKEAVRERWYRAAAGEYVERIRPFEGNAVVITAQARLRQSKLFDPHCGWAKHIPQLETHAVEADHTSLLESPIVGDVAAILLDALTRADGARAKRSVA